MTFFRELISDRTSFTVFLSDDKMMCFVVSHSLVFGSLDG